MIDIDTLPTSHVNEHVYRVIPTRYPQVSLFERVSGPEHWDVLYAVETSTNLRLRFHYQQGKIIDVEWLDDGDRR